MGSFDVYSWIVTEWTKCTAECDGGFQKRKVWCENDNHVKVKNKYCTSRNKPVRKQACNQQNCPTAWYSGRWSEVWCSVAEFFWVTIYDLTNFCSSVILKKYLLLSIVVVIVWCFQPFSVKLNKSHFLNFASIWTDSCQRSVCRIQVSLVLSMTPTVLDCLPFVTKACCWNKC